MQPHTAPSWRPSLSAGVPPGPSWTLPTPSWPGGAGLRTKIVPVSTIRAHAGVAGGRRLGVRGRGAVVVRRRGLRESGMEIGWSTKVYHLGADRRPVGEGGYAGPLPHRRRGEVRRRREPERRPRQEGGLT